MSPPLPTLSVCIPAYNRANFLPALLDSILTQNYPGVEIVISEDNSPQRPQISEVIQAYRKRGVDCIRYFENEKTLGFDGNLRILFARATGKYCVMMGNDDLLCPGSLATIGALLAAHPEVAVAIRSYGWFVDNPAQLDQIVRYFPATRIFDPGEDTAVTFFRRVGALAGLVFRREDSVAAQSDRFDGTLFYQIYLAAELLLKAHGLYIAETIAICREGKPDFGHSPAEKGKFLPGVYTSDARVAMVRGILDIASYIDAAHHTHIYSRVLKDMGNYSYSFLAFQANLRFADFWSYYRAMGEIGFSRNPFFHIYFWSLALFGKRFCEAVIRLLRFTFRATPRLGGIGSGTSLETAAAPASRAAPSTRE
jgi:abequosyltransferase